MNLFDETSIKTYGGLYNEVKGILDANGMDIGCSKIGYVSSIGTPPKRITLKKSGDIDDVAFLQYIFLALFQRLPSCTEMEALKGLNREGVIKKVVNKGSYSIRRIELTDCSCEGIKIGIRGKILGCAGRISSSTAFRKLAKKLPSGIQNKIRGLFC